MDDRYYQSKKQAAHAIYFAQPLIHSPVLDSDIVLGPEGFQHLSHSARGERTKEEQVGRFVLLPLAIHILKTATTLQAYRKRLMAVGGSGARGGRHEKTLVQWWGFVALFVKQDIKVRVVVRRVDGGKVHFWSVMHHRKPYGPTTRRRVAECK